VPPREVDALTMRDFARLTSELDAMEERED